MKLRLRTPNKHSQNPTPEPTSTPDPKIPRRRRRRRYRNHQKPFVCALCHARYTRRQTVYDHFPMCAQKNGNPKGLRWDEDVSCQLGRRQTACEEGPSSRCESVESGATEVLAEGMRRDDLEFGGGDDTEVDDEEVEMPSSPPRRVIPSSVFQRIAERELESCSEQESNVVEVGEKFEDGGEEKRLHPFTVMRIASLVILASKEHASRSVQELKAILDLWGDLDPEVAKPVVEFDEELPLTASARRMAVGVFANRVFSACLTEADGRHDGLLALTSGLRDVAAELKAADTVAKIHDLVSLALGDEGPLML